MSQLAFGSDPVTLGGHPFEAILTLWEESQELVQRLILEGRLGALEEELRDPLDPDATLALDVEDRVPVRIRNLHLPPAFSVQEDLNPGVTIRPVDLDEYLGFVELQRVLAPTFPGIGVAVRIAVVIRPSDRRSPADESDDQ